MTEYLTTDQTSAIDLTPGRLYFVDFAVDLIPGYELDYWTFTPIMQKAKAALEAQGHIIEFVGTPEVTDVMLRSEFAGGMNSKKIRFFFKAGGTPVHLLIAALLAAILLTLVVGGRSAILNVSEGAKFLGVGVSDFLTALGKNLPQILTTAQYGIIAAVLIFGFFWLRKK